MEASWLVEVLEAPEGVQLPRDLIIDIEIELEQELYKMAYLSNEVVLAKLLNVMRTNRLDYNASQLYVYALESNNETLAQRLRPDNFELGAIGAAKSPRVFNRLRQDYDVSPDQMLAAAVLVDMVDEDALRVLGTAVDYIYRDADNARKHRAGMTLLAYASSTDTRNELARLFGLSAEDLRDEDNSENDNTNEYDNDADNADDADDADADDADEHGHADGDYYGIHLRRHARRTGAAQRQLRR